MWDNGYCDDWGCCDGYGMCYSFEEIGYAIEFMYWDLWGGEYEAILCDYYGCCEFWYFDPDPWCADWDYYIELGDMWYVLGDYEGGWNYEAWYEYYGDYWKSPTAVTNMWEEGYCDDWGCCDGYGYCYSFEEIGYAIEFMYWDLWYGDYEAIICDYYGCCEFWEGISDPWCADWDYYVELGDMWMILGDYEGGWNYEAWYEYY